MKSVLLLLSFAIAISACSPAPSKTDVKQQLQEVLDQSEKDQKEIIENGEKAAEKVKADTLSITAPGGQPGTVYLAGDIISEFQSSSPRIVATFDTGLSWKNEKAVLDKKSLELQKELTKYDVESLGKVENATEELTLGCDEKSMVALPESFQIISAKSIVICGLTEFEKKYVSIYAQTITLKNADISFEGDLTQGISLVAQEVMLEGNSSISTKGTDSSVTLLGGPNVRIATDSLRGSGHLKIQAQGANYKP